MSLSGRSLIGAREGGGAPAARPLRAFDPARGVELEPGFLPATAWDVDEACELAAAAFPKYRDLPGERRAAFLESIAVKLEAAGEPMLERAAAESGLSAARLLNERGRTCAQLRFFAGIVRGGAWVDARIDRGDPARASQPKPELRSMLRPLGPVAVFGAANFPLAFSVAGGDTASALAAGCPVIAVAHESHPGTAEHAGRAIREAARESGLNPGVFSLLVPDGHDTGKRLITDLRLRAAGFTGSRAGGLALAALAAARAEPIPFYAEMSSLNPLFLLPGALAERGDALAAGLHASLTLGVGQFCTRPGLVVLVDDAAGLAFLVALAARFRAGAPGVMLNPRLRDAYANGAAARAAHPRVTALHAPALAPGCLGAPALFAVAAADFLADRSLRGELFGPTALIVRCGNVREFSALIDALEGGLTATVHAGANEGAEAAALLAALETKAGRLLWGGFPTGVEVGAATVHGGPFPATSDGRSTSVGGRAIERWCRPVCWQDAPQAALPPELQDGNPLGILRWLDGVPTR